MPRTGREISQSGDGQPERPDRDEHRPGDSRPHRHHMVDVVGQPVRPEHRCRVSDQSQLESGLGDLRSGAFQQPGRSLPLQQPRRRRLRNRLAYVWETSQT